MTQEKVPSIDDIMQNVAKEVERRGPYYLDNTTTNLGLQSVLPLEPELGIRFIQKMAYHRDDFMAYDDLEFVENAYLGILQRPADEAGLNKHVHFLRNGEDLERDKESVLCRLMSSDEAKNNGVTVADLQEHQTPKMAFHRDDFMAYDDLEFVEHAYLSIFQRPVDEVGLSSCMIFLRNGRGKEFVLCRLMSSDEAKNNGVTIAGLQGWRILYRLRKIFAINYIVRKTPLTGRFFEPWRRSNPELRHPYDNVTSPYVEQQLETYARQLAIQTGQIEQFNLQMQINQSELAICRGHTHSLLSRLEGDAPSNKSVSIESNQLSLQHKFDAFYLAFEDACRGSNEETSAKLQPYIPYIQQVVDEFGPLAIAVDIGCGRGEWLNLLKQFHITSHGVDVNQVMVDHCLSQGHQAEQCNALTWMHQQQPQSVHLISSFHVVEHIPFDEYYLWFEQFSRILAPGGLLILETPNPENLLVASHTFYHDPTHLNPITPALLEFTAKFFGLQVLAIERLNPHPVSAKVKGYDELTARFNGHLYGPQDFGLIAIKPREHDA